MPMMGVGGRRPRGVATKLSGVTPAGQPTIVRNMARAQMRKSFGARTPGWGRTAAMPMARPMQTAAAAGKTEASTARSLGTFLRGKKGLAIGGGALAFGAYELGKNRSTGRNGLQPSSSGGYPGY